MRETRDEVEDQPPESPACEGEDWKTECTEDEVQEGVTYRGKEHDHREGQCEDEEECHCASVEH